jgi:hypothetical protein
MLTESLAQPAKRVRCKGATPLLGDFPLLRREKRQERYESHWALDFFVHDPRIWFLGYRVVAVHEACGPSAFHFACINATPLSIVGRPEAISPSTIWRLIEWVIGVALWERISAACNSSSRRTSISGRVSMNCGLVTAGNEEQEHRDISKALRTLLRREKRLRERLHWYDPFREPPGSSSCVGLALLQAICRSAAQLLMRRDGWKVAHAALLRAGGLTGRPA